MSKKSNKLISRLFFLFLIISPCGVSYAALDVFSPYAYARVLHDSNIFRLSDEEEADQKLLGESIDDTITYLRVGFNSDLKLSRQHLLFDIQLDRAKYDNNDELDHTDVGGSARWFWLLGNLWSGNLGYRYRKELSSFNELDVRIKDMKTQNTAYFDAGYQINPDWRLEGGISVSDVTFDHRTNLDRDKSGAQFEVQYRNTLNTKVGARLRHTTHDLNANINDYEEDEVSGVLYWEGSGKSVLEARLGYVDLSYENAEDRDFQGISANLIFHWRLTGKTKLDISTWRETSSKNTEISTYVLSQGVSIRPTWSATRVFSVAGEFCTNKMILREITHWMTISVKMTLFLCVLVLIGIRVVIYGCL